MGQDETTPDTVSPELKAITEEAKILEQQKNISDYQAAIVANNLKMKVPFQLTAPTGTLSSEGDFAEPVYLSYESLTNGFKALFAKIKAESLTKDSKQKTSLIFYDKSQYDKVNGYRALLKQLSGIEKQINEHLKGARGNLDIGPTASTNNLSFTAAAVSIYGILNSIGGIASLFKTDLTINNTDVSFTRNDIIASFKSSIDNDEFDIYAPEIFPIPVSRGEVNTALTKALEDIDGLRNPIKVIIQEIDTRIKKESVVEMGKSLSEVKKEFIEKLNKHKTVLLGDITSIEAINKRLYTQSENSSELEILLSIEALENMLNSGSTYTIVLEAKGKGSVEHRKGLFSGNKVRFSAMSLVSCTLFDKTGKVVFSNIQNTHIPFKEFND